MIVYTLINSEGISSDFSYSLSATKRKATIDGYKSIGARNVGYYYVTVVSDKVDGMWKDKLGAENILRARIR